MKEEAGVGVMPQGICVASGGGRERDGPDRVGSLHLAVQDDNAVESIFAVNKPVGVSSGRVVGIVKKWAKEKTGNKKIRVGHGGTLDPLAEGVLVIAVGRDFTRQLEDAVQAEKEYIADVTFGYTSETDDSEGEKTFVSDRQPSREEIENILPQFIGEIQQETPQYSAVNVGGERAYEKARRGETFNLGQRTVHVETVQIVEYVYPTLKIRVVCGGGTYIRSIARDIGAALDVGAYMSALVRTRVGELDVESARSLEEFET